jgi:hypothetical protein
MADHANHGGGNNDVFVYMGGNQEVPRDVTHVRVHKSVKIITASAFKYCENLVWIEMHHGVEIIGSYAFRGCSSLRRIKLTGVRIIERVAFSRCEALEGVEFGDKLEVVGGGAFLGTSLRNVKLRKVRTIGSSAFGGCEQLVDVELSKDLERIGHGAFGYCPRLRHVTIPLKHDLFERCDVFENCESLSQVDLIIGGIHKFDLFSLPFDSWRNEMNYEITRINQVLPNTSAFKEYADLKTRVNRINLGYLPSFTTALSIGTSLKQYRSDDKTVAIILWIGRVIYRIKRYKSKHYTLLKLKEDMTLLELVLWKAKLNEFEEDDEISDLCALLEEDMTLEHSHRDDNLPNVVDDRQEARVTCGADVIIPRVFSFLNDAEEFPSLDHDDA